MNEQMTTILQQQLRDIHLPDAVTWWPLALGWWLVLFAGLGSLILISYRIIKYKQQNRYRKLALQELQSLFRCWKNTADNTDKSQYLQNANALLRRSIIHIDPDHNTTNKTGQDWINSLNRYTQQALQTDTADALAIACYQAKPDVDIPRIHKELTMWFQSHNRSKHA